jgi:hypothetical protein
MQAVASIIFQVNIKSKNLFYWSNLSHSQEKTDFSEDFRLQRPFDTNFGPVLCGSRIPFKIYYHVSTVRLNMETEREKTNSKNLRNYFNTDTICFLKSRKRI